MRQAIEEGFILDVLKCYTTYSTAWKLAHPNGEDDEVDSKRPASSWPAGFACTLTTSIKSGSHR